MQKLTDWEFRTITSVMSQTADGSIFRALQKLLANYQAQLEAESYVSAERYTEANTEPTLEVDTSGIVQESDSLDEIWDKTLPRDSAGYDYDPTPECRCGECRAFGPYECASVE